LELQRDAFNCVKLGQTNLKQKQNLLYFKDLPNMDFKNIIQMWIITVFNKIVDFVDKRRNGCGMDHYIFSKF